MVMIDAELHRQLNRDHIEVLEEDVAKLEEQYKTSKKEEDRQLLIKNMYQLAIAYQEKGDDERAQEVYDKVYEIDPYESRIVNLLRKMTPK
ncbi:hypothetical protein KY317_02000 [Candidatus Woesearchaeota archaeon]|nr:hypothetical protein [Candidatus Woesearchaeota archaeon]